MISQNNADLDVDELMQRVRDEAAAMRARTSALAGDRSSSGTDEYVPEIVIDLSRHTAVTQLIEDATRNSRPRSTIPKRLNRTPFQLAQPLTRFCLRILNYALKDQRHVNTATQQALRELLRLVTTIGGHVAQNGPLSREQRNAVRDVASLKAGLAASEQRSAEFFERYGDADQRFSEIAARLQALETAMTLNAGRIDRVESELPTVQSDRGTVNDRLLGVETAHTIAAQRLERLEGFQAQSHLLNSAISDTRHELGAERERALRSEAALRSELTANLNTLRALVKSPDASATGNVLQQGLPETGDRYTNVHLAIADRFRGDSSRVKDQLEQHLSLVRETCSVNAANPLVDIGSGRAEWLSICRDNDVSAYGIELNSALVARARADGLDVREGDALRVLRDIDSCAIGAITAFHVIEHVSFEYLLELFDESLRALIPGGLIICETPNPANVTIGSCNFYLDPTHNHPLPAPLVAFLLELRGFTDIRIIELEPNDAMRIAEDTEAARRLNGFFYGPQNYATIARKPGESN